MFGPLRTHVMPKPDFPLADSVSIIRNFSKGLTPNHRHYFKSMHDPQFSCPCGQNFAQQNALGNHQHACKKMKARTAGALTKMRAARAKKARTSSDMQILNAGSSASTSTTPAFSGLRALVNRVSGNILIQSPDASNQDDPAEV